MFSGSLLHSLVALDLGVGVAPSVRAAGHWKLRCASRIQPLPTRSDEGVSRQAGAGGPRAAPPASRAARTRASSGTEVRALAWYSHLSSDALLSARLVCSGAGPC